MTLAEAKKIFLNRGYIEVPGGTYYDADKWRESITVISKWLEQEPCDDYISRRAVLDTLDKMDKALDVDRTVENYKELLTECYKDLTPVIPKEKIGKWEIATTTFCGRTFEVIQCSCCKKNRTGMQKQISVLTVEQGWRANDGRTKAMGVRQGP